MKPIYQSKTAWLQVLTLVGAFLPPVQAFLVANPVAAVAVLSSVNLLVRFVTQGKISIFADGSDGPGDNSSGGPASGIALLGMVGTAAVLGMALPSCSPAQITAAEAVPIHSRLVTRHAVLGYDSATGISIEVDTASGK